MKTVWKVLPFIVLGLGAALHLGCPRSVEQPLTLTVEDLVLSGGSEVFSVPLDHYQTPGEERPIGVFDSGIGGLTVLNEIVTIDRFNNQTHEPGADGRADFEHESFVYLGDQANMPYGNYPSEDKVDFLKELILKDVVFVLGNRYWLSRS
ncbi:MAG: hypothetical protein JSV80_00890, partial [Acidobacteriota bacterium]